MSASRSVHVSASIGCLVVAMATIVGPPASAQGRWTYSIGGGAVDRFTYQVTEFSFGRYPDYFPSGVQGNLGATRTLTRHVSVHLEAGYRGYSHELGLVQIPEAPPTTGRLRAEYFPVSAGLRVAPFGDLEHGLRPYVQFAPALFMSRWEERVVDHDGYNMTTGAWRPRTTHVDTQWNVLPGFVAAVGCQVRVAGVIGIDGAVRYTRSRDAGHQDLGRFSTGEFLGLADWSAVAGLTWAP